MKKKISDLSKEEMLKLINTNTSINSILKQLNVNSNGSGAYRTFKNHCKRLEIEIPKYKNIGNGTIGPKIDMNEILIKDSTYQNITRLKIRLINEGLMEYKCSGENCLIKDIWNGKLLVLQLDHINGVNNDNRLENLRFLCPNCHSQTTTFSGRANKKK